MRVLALAIIGIAVPVSGNSQIYTVTGDVLSGYMDMLLTDWGNSSGPSYISHYTYGDRTSYLVLDETVYIDLATQTIRQVGHIGCNHHFDTVWTEEKQLQGTKVSGTVEVEQWSGYGVSQLAFDTGARPYKWDPSSNTYTFDGRLFCSGNFYGTYSLDTGGQTFSGGFHYYFSGPIYGYSRFSLENSDPMDGKTRTYRTMSGWGAGADVFAGELYGGSDLNLTAANGFQLFLKPGGVDSTEFFRATAQPDSAVRIVDPPDPRPVLAWGGNTYGQTNMPPDLTNALAVSAGFYHSLARKAEGIVVGWGKDENGEADVPLGLSNVTAIAAGQSFSLALRRDGTVQHWGWGGNGLREVAATLSNVVAISAGWDHAMALKKDGRVVAWGSNSSGQTNVPPNLQPVLAIAAGGFHSLAVQADGTVVAWGRNTSGQTNVPTGLGSVVAIAGGGRHSLALKADGTVVAWGAGTNSTGANYNYGQSMVPTGLTNVMSVSGGCDHSLALKRDGTLVAWGDNSFGQINVPANLPKVVAISAGGYHNLALLGAGLQWIRIANVQQAPNGDVQLNLSGSSGDAFRVLSSTNLQDWQTIASLTNVTGTVYFTHTGAASYSQRFYRCVIP
jgi:hypothetical protein